MATDALDHETTVERRVLRLAVATTFRVTDRGRVGDVVLAVDGPDADRVLAVGQPTVVGTRDGEVVGSRPARALGDESRFRARLLADGDGLDLALHGDLDGWRLRLRDH